MATYLESNVVNDFEEDDNTVFDQEAEHDIDSEDTFLDHLHISTFAQMNYFVTAKALSRGCIPSAPTPCRTFSTATTAFHLALKPSLRMSIDEAANKFNLPDLRPALCKYFRHLATSLPHTVSGIRSCKAFNLPSERIQIWYRIHVQQMCYYKVTPDTPQTL